MHNGEAITEVTEVILVMEVAMDTAMEEATEAAMVSQERIIFEAFRKMPFLGYRPFYGGFHRRPFYGGYGGYHGGYGGYGHPYYG